LKKYNYNVCQYAVPNTNGSTRTFGETLLSHIIVIQTLM